MGYNIYYEGIVKLDKPLDNQTYDIIMNLATTRRMIWDAEALERDEIAKREEIGWQGEFFFPNQTLSRKERKSLEEKYVLDFNIPPGGQPDVNGVWIVTEDKEGLIWNQKEKSYLGHEWLQYIVKSILIPRDYKPYGIINWFAEYEAPPRKFHTIVKENSVIKKRGYHKAIKEPDIDGWFERELDDYKKSHQKWVSMLVEETVQFLHENKYNGTLSFNLYLDNDILQTTLKEGEVSSCKYLYRNIRREKNEWVHEEDFENQIEEALLLKRVKDTLLSFMNKQPDFLDKSVI